MTVTYFPRLTDSQSHKTTDLSTILEAIKDGGKSKSIIEKLRDSPRPEEKDTLKKSLPLVLFSGRFSERKASALIEYSKVICIDFDHVPNVWAKKQSLALLPFIYACWVSPSGDGVKALVRVSSDHHAGHAEALLGDFPDADAAAIKDVSRACFMSYDPEIYVNKNAEIYDKIVVSAHSDAQKYDNLKKWLDGKGEKFISGNRNNFVTKLAGAANRFGIGAEYLRQRMEQDYVKGDFAARELNNVITKVYTNYADQFGSVNVDEIWTNNKVNSVLHTSIEVNDVIYLGAIKEDLINDYELGTQRAPTTYFEGLDRVYRPQRGDLNVFSGAANSGKSAFQKQIDLVAAVKEGQKSLYFSPEEYPPTFWYRELIRSYVGKPVEKDDPMRMSRQEYDRAMEFIHEHFIYVYPPELPTPDYILERFVEAVIKHRVDRIVLDPWNQLNHVMNKRDDIYLGETLSKFERFAQQYGVYMTVICHPNRTHKKDDGNYDCPDVYDLNGGPVWSARATNIVVYHRPKYQTDKSDPTFEFHSKKIKKQMVSGLPGVVTGSYNRRIGRFYVEGMNPLETLGA